VKKTLLLVPLFALLLQGCGMTMTRYEPSFDNVQKLKQTPSLHAISNPQVTAESGEGSLMVRANPIKSPTGSIPAHIQDAITEELRKAGLLDPNATRHLQVLVVKNQLNAGMGTGDGKIAARFTMLDGKNVVYDATKEVSHQWSSSFFGFIAIRNATNAYNPMLKDLLKDLYSDPQFIQALK